MKFAWPTTRLAATFLRTSLLALAALAAAASTEPQSQPQYPYAQPQPGYYSQTPGAEGEPGVAAPAPTSGAPGQDYCFTLATAKTTTSICTVGFGGCERQRQGAVADGQTTSECVPWSPVACFQLGGDPAPTQRFCAANLEDCETWRGLDQAQNGGTSAACAVEAVSGAMVGSRSPS
jgi:hypothetical protein